MGKTYKAVEITKPGIFRLVEKPVVEPGEEQVRIRVEACGVCHSDAGTVEGQLPGVMYPRVPGHEAIGLIEEVGRRVTTWKVGQRVGVGFFGGEDGTCETCRRGDTAYCQNPIITGVTSDGGYAEMMIAEARALALIPDELKSADAAPLVCAGITTFNALRNAGRAGDTVAIQGIGGLGQGRARWNRMRCCPAPSISSRIGDGEIEISRNEGSGDPGIHSVSLRSRRSIHHRTGIAHDRPRATLGSATRPFQAVSSEMTCL